MAIGEEHSLQVGWLHRHLPHSSGLALDVAVLDVAQDFLLSHLAENEVFAELVIFKGAQLFGNCSRAGAVGSPPT